MFLKNTVLEFKRLLHPRAIIPLKINGRTVAGKVRTHIIIFLLLYLFLFVVGALVVSAQGLDFVTSIGAVAACLGNVGPAIGEVGPVDHYGWTPPFVKYLLSIYMIIGRLEIFTVLVLLTPFFWKSN